MIEEIFLKLIPKEGIKTTRAYMPVQIEKIDAAKKFVERNYNVDITFYHAGDLVFDIFVKKKSD